MSSIFSTQKRHTFLRRKYCFLPTAAALSPPVGRCEAAIGLPPFCSAMGILLIPQPPDWFYPVRRAPDVRAQRVPPELRWVRQERDAILRLRHRASAAQAKAGPPEEPDGDA